MRKPRRSGAGTELKALIKLYSNPCAVTQPTHQRTSFKPWLKAVVATLGRKRLLPAGLAQWLIKHGGLHDE